MPRRRLALYTLFFIAGITAGFFMLERSRILEAAGFCAALFAATCFSDNKQKGILAMMFFAGFMPFSIRSMSYDAAFSYVQDDDCVDSVALLIRDGCG